MQRQILVPTEPLGKDISNYTIGLARLTQSGKVEDAVSAGSGTLVTVGSLHGILTAAHVVDALPKRGQVGVVLNVEPPGDYRRTVMNMEHVEEPVVIRAEEFGRLGPDLAFLKLTDEVLGWLKARCSFFNLAKRRDDVLAGKEPSTSHTDVITGVIHELTTEGPSEKPGVRRIEFHAIFAGVRPSAVRYLSSHDLFYVQFATEHEPDFKIPGSFEGTSGGAVWRFYVIEKNGKAEVIDKRLIAVPFHQGFSMDGKREIACHGARSIYGSLIDKVVERWPNEAKLDQSNGQA